MKLKKKFIISLIFVAMLLMLKNISYAGTQRWNSVDYDVTLNEDGSMDVVETWDIYVSETNTLFKNFEIDSSKYSGITDVNVKDISTGKEFIQINEEMYHVTKDCYYALPISGGKFEIAWGVGLDSSSANKKYQISYTIEDVVTVYNDCSELYWQFVGTDNGIPANKVTGTIKLPSAVSDLEKLRVWAHGPLNGEIHKISNDTVVFYVDDFDSETMLEVRIVTEDQIFNDSTKVINHDKLNSIITEETEWAEEANRQREQMKKMFIRIAVVIIVVYLIVLYFFGKKIIKYIRESKNVEDDPYNIQVCEYFRDIPREKTSTPADAAYLFYSNGNRFSFGGHESNVFSATLLDLCLKRYIAFEKDKNDHIKIIFLEPSRTAVEKLTLSEQNILKLLKNANTEHTESITIEQLKKYAKSEYDEFAERINALEKNAKEVHIDIGNYNEKNAKEVFKCNSKIAAYVIGCIMIFGFLNIFAIPIIIEFIVAIMFLRKISKKIKILTEQGETERQEWKALKKYMEDFSMLKERDIPDLVLWEKYLVYATAFGISDKVIKQLKVVYPEMSNLDGSTYCYMHMMSSSNYGNNFLNEFNAEVNSAYSAYRSAYSSAHSSGSGGGGGFSGGGGGRRWRWPDAVVDNFKGDFFMKIGIDIGGSHIGIGIIENQEIIASKEKNFNREDRKNIEKTIIESIQNLICELINENNLNIEDIELIGIADTGKI